MELRCLNCQAPVSEGDARLHEAVFVCPACKSLAEAFVRDLEQDLVIARAVAGDYVRAMLRTGSFHPTYPANPAARVSSLLRWEEERRCLASLSTLTSSPRTLPSGASSPLSVTSADSRRSSSS